MKAEWQDCTRPGPLPPLTDPSRRTRSRRSARAALIADATAAVARAEGAAVDAVATRVWVFPTEIDDGCWGTRGTVRRLPDIMEYFGGATLRALGEQRLATKRRADAGRVVDAVRDSMREMDRNRFHEAAAGVVR